MMTPQESASEAITAAKQVQAGIRQAMRTNSRRGRLWPTERGFGAIIRTAYPKHGDGEPVLNLRGEPASGLVWRTLPERDPEFHEPCPVCDGCGDDGIYGIGHSCHVCGGSGWKVPE